MIEPKPPRRSGARTQRSEEEREAARKEAEAAKEARKAERLAVRLATSEAKRQTRESEKQKRLAVRLKERTAKRAKVEKKKAREAATRQRQWDRHEAKKAERDARRPLTAPPGTTRQAFAGLGVVAILLWGLWMGSSAVYRWAATSDSRTVAMVKAADVPVAELVQNRPPTLLERVAEKCTEPPAEIQRIAKRVAEMFEERGESMTANHALGLLDQSIPDGAKHVMTCVDAGAMTLTIWEASRIR